MASESTATETTLDVREIDGPPFDEIVAALEARGYAYETVEGSEASDDASSSRTQSGDDDEVVTVIWRA